MTDVPKRTACTNNIRASGYFAYLWVLCYNVAPSPQLGVGKAGSMSAPKRVLVVEDFEDSRVPLVKLLELEGYAVAEAADGIQAVERAIATTPDLILMDLSLPIVDGFAAISRIRDHPPLARVPIIALSGHELAETATAEALGCAAYLTKPVDFQGLLGLISKLLRGRAADSSK